MADQQGMFRFLQEFASSFLADIISLGLLRKKDATGKILTQEQAEAITKGLVPKIFGAGRADEAIFEVTLAKLEDRRNIKISRFLETLSKADRSSFILTVSILPEEKDRITVLNMYSELSPAEMKAMAMSARMITGKPSLDTKASELAVKLEPVPEKLRQFSQNLRNRYGRRP